MYTILFEMNKLWLLYWKKIDNKDIIHDIPFNYNIGKWRYSMAQQREQNRIIIAFYNLEFYN